MNFKCAKCQKYKTLFFSIRHAIRHGMRHFLQGNPCKKVVSPKFENCAHLFILNYNCTWFCSKNVEKNPIQVWNFGKILQVISTPKNNLWDFLIKWTEINFKGISLMFFSRRSDQFILYPIPTPTLVLYVLCMKPSQNRKNVLSDIFFCNVLSEHHSSLNLTTTPHYVLVVGRYRRHLES